MDKSNIKIRLTEDDLCEIIGQVIESLGYKKQYLLEYDVMRECLNNAIITEGLVKTFSYTDVRKVLLNLGIARYGIRVSTLPFFKYSNHEGKRPVQIILIFTNGISDIPIEYIDDIFHKMDVLGWYFASVIGHGKVFDYDELSSIEGSISCVFEPKFDVLLGDDDIPNTLYHILPSRLVDKVMKKGLVPKSGSMFTNHPERVFLFMENPSDMLDSITASFNNGKGIDEEYTVLKIDYGKIRQGNKFYIDPNSNYINACFTLEPIPPFAIEVAQD